MSRLRSALVALAAAVAPTACSGSSDAAPASSPPLAAAAATSTDPVEAVPTLPPSSPAGTSGATVATTAETGEWCERAGALNRLATEFRNLDAADTGAVRDTLAAVLAELDAIEPLAPPALATDLAVSAEAFRLLDTALSGVAYDLSRADLSAVEARTAAITTANERIREYNHTTCGLDAGVTGEDLP